MRDEPIALESISDLKPSMTALMAHRLVALLDHASARGSMFDLLIPDDRQVCWSESTMHGSSSRWSHRCHPIQCGTPPSAIGSRRDGLRRRGVRRWSAHADAWDSARLGIDPEMLDQDTNEALHAPERCAMDHDGSMSTTIGSDVPEIEPFREIVIHLNRVLELPLRPMTSFTMKSIFFGP